MDDEKARCVLHVLRNGLLLFELFQTLQGNQLVTVAHGDHKVTSVLDVEDVSIRIHGFTDDLRVVSHDILQFPLGQKLLHVFDGSGEVGEGPLRVQLYPPAVAVVQDVEAVRKDVDGCSITEHCQVFTGAAVELNSCHAKTFDLDEFYQLCRFILKQEKHITVITYGIKLFWEVQTYCSTKTVELK